VLAWHVCVKLWVKSQYLQGKKLRGGKEKKRGGGLTEKGEFR
jgi:hypothetical protein